MASRSQHSAPKSYGAPIDGTPKPGQSQRKRPKPGDRDPNYDPDKKKKKPSPPPKKETPPKDDKPKYPHRDWRGTRGAIEDAEG